MAPSTPTFVPRCVYSRGRLEAPKLAAPIALLPPVARPSVRRPGVVDGVRTRPSKSPAPHKIHAPKRPHPPARPRGCWKPASPPPAARLGDRGRSCAPRRRRGLRRRRRLGGRSGAWTGSLSVLVLLERVRPVGVPVPTARCDEARGPVASDARRTRARRVGSRRTRCASSAASRRARGRTRAGARRSCCRRARAELENEAGLAVHRRAHARSACAKDGCASAAPITAAVGAGAAASAALPARCAMRAGKFRVPRPIWQSCQERPPPSGRSSRCREPRIFGGLRCRYIRAHSGVKRDGRGVSLPCLAPAPAAAAAAAPSG